MDYRLKEHYQMQLFRWYLFGNISITKLDNYEKFLNQLFKGIH